jgi:transposase
MTYTKEIESEVIRLSKAEKWKIGTIAEQLQIHHGVVERILTRNEIPVVAKRKRRKSIFDKYLPFVESVLAKYPKLTAARLYQMTKDRGYLGGSDHFRHMLSKHRPRKLPEAYLRLRTLPGEQAQVDWGYFGKIKIGNTERPLFGFVMVLSWSRQIFLKFYTGLATAHFLQAHVDAFTQWNGVPRELLYDNLKSAVLERIGDSIRFNPRLLAFAAHYKYAPKPVAVARGNEKGKVERAIQYIRHSFFEAGKWDDLEDLNQQASKWCREIAGERKCKEDESKTVQEAFESEQSSLIKLPDNEFPVHEVVVASVGKTPYVRFDLNDYSVPFQYVRQQVTVMANSDWVTITDGTKEIAKHKRCFEKSRQIENKEHIEELVERKKKAKRGKGLNTLTCAAPSASELFKKAAERGHAMGGMTAKLLSLLELYGPKELEEAIATVLKSDASHCSDVAMELEKRRRRKGLLPPIAIQLPKDARLTNMVVKPHSLASYDNLFKKENE